MRTLIVALWLFPAAALAGGYAIPNENARELALGQATVAAQNGPEAVYQNPAALAGQQGFAVTVNGQLLYNKTKWSDPGLGSAKIKDNPTFPPALAAAWGDKLPNGMPYGVGLGFNVIGGGSLKWPQDWPGSTRIQSVALNVFLTELGAGIEPIPGLKVGASLLYYRITEKLTQQLDFVTTNGQAELGVAGGAFSFGAGADYQVPTLPLKLGAFYRHQGAVTLKGDAHFAGVPPSFQTALVDQGVSEDLTVPSELFVGAAVQATPELQVMGAWSWEKWDVYKNDTFVGDKGFTVTVPRNYNNAWVYRLGLEYAKPSFLPELALRLGVDRSISNQPSDTLSPSLTDASSWGVSVGAGYQFTQSLRADIGYQLGLLDKATASGPEALAGSYETTVHFVSLGLTYRMEPAH